MSEGYGNRPRYPLVCSWLVNCCILSMTFSPILVPRDFETKKANWTFLQGPEISSKRHKQSWWEEPLYKAIPGREGKRMFWCAVSIHTFKCLHQRLKIRVWIIFIWASWSFIIRKKKVIQKTSLLFIFLNQNGYVENHGMTEEHQHLRPMHPAKVRLIRIELMVQYLLFFGFLRNRFNCIT